MWTLAGEGVLFFQPQSLFFSSFISTLRGILLCESWLGRSIQRLPFIFHALLSLPHIYRLTFYYYSPLPLAGKSHTCKSPNATQPNVWPMVGVQ